MNLAVLALGDCETFIIFDDVFIPKERVFLNGHVDHKQTPYAGFLALMFSHNPYDIELLISLSYTSL